jgi:dienelactone hydrolase
LILPDVYGIDSGRHKLVADEFAKQCGYYVVLPDLFRGDPPFTENIDPTVGSQRIFQKYKYSHLEHDLVQSIYPFCCNEGARQVAALGFCYGAYLWTFLAMEVELVCCVSPHPSIVPLANGAGDDWKSAFSTMKNPILLINAEGDAPEQMPNGIICDLMGKRRPACESEYHVFQMVKHGWSIRGDVTDTIIQQATQEAFELIVEFLQKHFGK